MTLYSLTAPRRMPGEKKKKKKKKKKQVDGLVLFPSVQALMAAESAAISGVTSQTGPFHSGYK